MYSPAEIALGNQLVLDKILPHLALSEMKLMRLVCKKVNESVSHNYTFLALARIKIQLSDVNNATNPFDRMKTPFKHASIVMNSLTSKEAGIFLNRKVWYGRLETMTIMVEQDWDIAAGVVNPLLLPLHGTLEVLRLSGNTLVNLFSFNSDIWIDRLKSLRTLNVETREVDVRRITSERTAKLFMALGVITSKVDCLKSLTVGKSIGLSCYRRQLTSVINNSWLAVVNLDLCGHKDAAWILENISSPCITEFGIQFDQSSNRSLVHFLNRHYNLTKIELCSSNRISSALFRAIKRASEKLVRLVISGRQLGSDRMSGWSFLKKMDALEEFSLAAKVEPGLNHMTFGTCEEVIYSLPNTLIRIKIIGLLLDQPLDTRKMWFPCLKSFHLERKEVLLSVDIGALKRRKLTNYPVFCTSSGSRNPFPQLKHLHMTQSHGNNFETACMISQNWPNLESISLRRCGLDHQMLSSLSLFNLLYIDVSYNFAVEEQDLQSFVRRHSRLKKVVHNCPKVVLYPEIISIAIQ